MLKDSTKWYASWFDTPYYHILYKDRNHSEAQVFMDTLTHYLHLEPGDTILDLACGKGRHSIYLNTIGFDVTGADLSKNSIDYATQYQNETLKFVTHDMCKPFGSQFEAVFNLFTSFGYFEEEKNNFDTIKAIKANLKETGCAVIDFMNVERVINNLVPKETKTVDTITFDIKRFVKDGYIHKEIRFRDDGADYFFTEKVKAITLQDFIAYFEAAGLYLLELFGSYQLEKFDPVNSERLILMFK